MTDTATATGRLDAAWSRTSCRATARRGTRTGRSSCWTSWPGHRLRRRRVAADDALARRRARVPRARVGGDPRPRVRGPRGPVPGRGRAEPDAPVARHGDVHGPHGPARVRPANGRIEFTGFDLHEFRDGRLSRLVILFDNAEVGGRSVRCRGGVARRARRRGAAAPAARRDAPGSTAASAQSTGRVASALRRVQADARRLAVRRPGRGARCSR